MATRHSDALECPGCRETAIEVTAVQERMYHYHATMRAKQGESDGRVLYYVARCYRCNHRWKPRKQDLCEHIVQQSEE